MNVLKRKIEKDLLAWKNNKGKKTPLVIRGCRQCGKTFIVKKFAEENYENVVYINFLENKDYNDVFKNSLNVDELVKLISSLTGNKVKIEPEKTVLIFDEIQECPDARASLKFFKEDGRYDVISTGSLLGIKGYKDSPRSIPVGAEEIIKMFPLDFEEFLWANGIGEDIILELKGNLNKELQVNQVLHNRLRKLLLEYISVGGMPNVVNEFLATNDMGNVLKAQRDILDTYKDDMIKYAENRDKVLLRECFESIPKQLSKENKKFQYSLVKKGGTASRFLGVIQWIEDAGIINRCYNLNNLELPLAGNSMRDVFKIYMEDIGLLIAMLDDGTAFDILKGNLYTYKGAIFENFIAGTFSKLNKNLYYFHKDSGLEIDFVMRYKGQSTLIEVKATTGKSKSLKTILNDKEKYHINSAIKIGDYNIGRSGEILTIPSYMAFMLDEV